MTSAVLNSLALEEFIIELLWPASIMELEGAPMFIAQPAKATVVATAAAPTIEIRRLFTVKNL